MSFRHSLVCFVLAATAAAQFAPGPSISSLNPSSATVGSSGFTMTINGSNILQCDTPTPCVAVIWTPSGGAVTTLSPSSIGPNGNFVTVNIPVNLLTTPGTVAVSVTAFGGTSNSLTFTINYPTPVISALSPAQAFVGGSAFTLTVSGTGFVQNSVVQINGASQSTVFINAQTLTTTVGEALLGAGGELSIAVAQPNGVISAPVNLPVVYSEPSISAVTPAQVAATTSSVSITINGTGFFPATTVQLGGTLTSSNFISGQQLTATVPAAELAAAGNIAVTVTNPTAQVSNSVFLAVVGPTITTISPNSAAAGSAGFTLAVNGSNFVPVSSVTWNGTAVVTTFVSASQLAASVPATLIASPGTAAVRVQNTSQAISGPVTFTVSPPAPAITSLSPNSAIAGSAALTLTVNGTGFVSGSVVNWNGTALATMFVSATQLTAAVSAMLLAQADSATVQVVNAAQTQSNTATFTINPAPPVITAINPSSAVVGSAAFTLTVTGTGFLSGAIVQWGSTPVTTGFSSATQLTAAVSATLLTQAGSVSIVVINPNKTQSNTVNFTVTAVIPPSITSLSPASKDAGGAAFTLTVNGSGFVNGAVVNWNGSTLVTVFVSAMQLTASVSAALIANPGSATVTVVNPDGTTSAGATFAITLPAPPAVTFSAPADIGAAQQPTMTFALAAAYPLPISGEVDLTFTPNAVNPADDPAIQFSSGGRTLTFSIPANSTQVPSISIQTGTVSGTVLLHMSLESGGTSIPVSDVTIQIVPSGPVIRSVSVTRSTGSLQLTIVGFATPREVTQAVFHFNPASASSVQVPDVTVNAGTLFTPWFQSTESNQYGSQFTYTQTFNVQGDASQLGTIVVTLSNSAGSSQSVTSN